MRLLLTTVKDHIEISLPMRFWTPALWGVIRGGGVRNRNPNLGTLGTLGAFLWVPRVRGVFLGTSTRNSEFFGTKKMKKKRIFCHINRYTEFLKNRRVESRVAGTK